MNEEEWDVDCWKISVQRVKNYFIDSLLFQDFLETDENLEPKEPDFDNEADTELEAEEECLWEINPIIISIDNLDFNTTANVEGEWFINEDLDLVYFSVFASDSVLSDTSTDVDSDQWLAVDALTLLYVPIKSSFMVREKTSDA